MLRAWLCVMACVAVGGCVGNRTTIQSSQITPVIGSVPAARPPAPPPAPVLTPAARLASARLVTVSKTTTAGATLLLASPQALARDCSPLGEVTVKVAEQPEHGTIHVGKGTAFPNYTPGDAPYLCNARRSPATMISYQPAPGYTGQDVAVVDVFFPDGRAPTIRFDITVR